MMERLPSIDRMNYAEAVILAVGGQKSGLGETHPEMPVVHRFTPGLYIREIFMPAGSVLTSKIHKTEHPFVVSKGLVCVYSDNDGVQVLEAPFTGITKPWTKRFLVVIEDTIWTTFHPTRLTNVEDIEREIIEAYENPLLAETSA